MFKHVKIEILLYSLFSILLFFFLPQNSYFTLRFLKPLEASPYFLFQNAGNVRVWDVMINPQLMNHLAD